MSASTTATAANPAVGAAISGGSGMLGSVFSGLFNRAAIRKQNQANMKINQMNNEFNALEAAKARDWQTEENSVQREWQERMWNMENEYNTPAAQRQRLLEAGYSPDALVGGAGQYSSAVSQVPGASSSGAGSNASSSQPPQMLPESFQVDFSSVSSAINSYYQNRALTADATGKNIQNDIQRQLGMDYTLSQIAQNVGGAYEWLTPEYIKKRQSVAPLMVGVDLNKKVLENDALKSTINLHISQGALAYMNAKAQGILNKYLDAQQQADLMIKSSEIYMNVMDGNLSYQKAQESIKQQVLIGLQSAGQRISNRIASQTAAAVISAISEEAYYERDYYHALRKESKRLAKSQADLSDAEVRKVNELVRRYQKENGWLWFDKLTGAASRGADAYFKTKIGKNIGRSRYSFYDIGREDFSY